MRRSLLIGALLVGASSMSSAAEVHIDEHTLCPVALRAFDETDLPAIEEFLRLVQGVFDELNARHTDQEETAPTAKLTGKSIEVPLILAFCVSILGQLFIRRRQILMAQCAPCELP